jgi:hypothetical protein
LGYYKRSTPAPRTSINKGDSHTLKSNAMGRVFTICPDGLFIELLTCAAAKQAVKKVPRKSRDEEMIDEERQKVKARLIESGFWGADEPGDPTRNLHDAGTLNERLQAKLARDVFLVSRIVSDHSLIREVLIFHDFETYTLVTDAVSYPEAISLAALALPEFLRRHPECAADRK